MKALSLILMSFIAIPAFVSGQILEIVPERMGKIFETEPSAGRIFTGTTGLITMPTPAIQESNSFGISYRGGSNKRNINLSGTRYRMTQAESYFGISYHATPNVEISAHHLQYKRESSPSLDGLNIKDQLTGGGIKYSANNGEQQFCFGLAFTPMTSIELNRADLFQIEQLRSAYFTVSENLSTGLTGHIGLKVSVTSDQKIEVSPTETVKISRKEFLTSGIGLEYKISEMLSIMGEGKFTNYRDLYTDENTRFEFNAGIRLGSSNIQLEATAQGIQEDPNYHFGLGVSF